MTKALSRLISDVPGLDDVLGGGFVAGSSYIIQGQPGSGKTILANQIAFAQMRQGRSVLYVTLLAESHDRLFQSLSTLRFYEPRRVGAQVTYISLLKVFRDEGLLALVEVLRAELRRQSATILILDGLLNTRDQATDDLDIKSFVSELQSHAAFTGCTVFFLTSANANDSSPEHTMVDGVVQLREELFGSRTVRRLRVAKSRGSASLGGLHTYEIADQGIIVYPRLEALLATPSAKELLPARRIATGVANLDERMAGGLPAESVSLVIGPAGSGKTTFGLNFLRLGTPQEPALHFGFYETPERLLAKAETLEMPLRQMTEVGALRVMWNPLTENLLDRLGRQLLHAVREHGIKRLFIDGMGGFESAAVVPDRLAEFFAALTNELRAIGVTTVGTWETKQILGPAVTNPAPRLISMLDGLIGMHHAMDRSKLRRGMTIIKLRDSAFDPSIAEAEISAGGIRVVGPMPSTASTMPQAVASSDQTAVE
ncbi:ATPase domain-containing protein [Caballeronia sp. LZ016]|uniref:ATPase domain-containing protein n=1 Tax=Caballeronia sp. LZ016 TaxID=3038554 RepID=UPI0028556846|nr:ATPase domain-containing protein [Caballeronia sp. LZ016]MDR5740139.1 ATPase domain-containing protein [Caballeronia sp. LZ016]